MSEKSPQRQPDEPADRGAEALSWAVDSGNAEVIVARLRLRRRERQRRRLGAVAALVLVSFVGVWQWRTRARPLDEVTYPTTVRAVSLPVTTVLPDGSVVEARDGASVASAYTPAQRRVVLRAGEAHFQVRKDPARDFIVEAHGVEVRAVGTAFAVQLSGNAVEVVVTEGTVAVDPPASATARQPVLVTAGERLVIGRGEEAEGPRAEVRRLSDEERDARLAWRTPRFEFDGTPLAEVVQVLNRHGAVKLSLQARLEGLQVSGTLRADDLESLITLLRNEFGIESAQRADGSLHLFHR
jgi:transmembrane sensor